MIAVVPERKKLQPDYDPATAGKLTVPITLVRKDGGIFPPSGEQYIYTPEPVAVPTSEQPSQPPTKRQRLEAVKTEEPSASTPVFPAEPPYQPSTSSQLPFSHYSSTPSVNYFSCDHAPLCFIAKMPSVI